MKKITQVLIFYSLCFFSSYILALDTYNVSSPEIACQAPVKKNSATSPAADESAFISLKTDEPSEAPGLWQNTVVPSAAKGAVVGLAIILAPGGDTVINGLITGELVKLGFEQLSSNGLTVPKENEGFVSTFVNRVPMTAISSYSTCAAAGDPSILTSCFTSAYARNLVSFDFANKFTDYLVNKYPSLSKTSVDVTINLVSMEIASMALKAWAQRQLPTRDSVTSDIINAAMNSIPFIYASDDSTASIKAALGTAVVAYIIYWVICPRVHA